MIVAIHQPNHLPWVGYWIKLLAADAFVLYDTCPLSKGGYTTRVCLPGTPAPPASSLPVRRFALGTPIADVELNLTDERRARLLARLGFGLGSLAHSASAVEPLRRVLESTPDSSSVAAFNSAVIHAYAERLGSRTRLVRAGALLGYRPGPEHLLHLSQGLGANVYLSGSGGARQYLRSEAFEAQGVDVAFVDFTAAARRVVGDPGLVGCTFLGALATLGWERFRENLAHEAAAVRRVASRENS